MKNLNLKLAIAGLIFIAVLSASAQPAEMNNFRHKRQIGVENVKGQKRGDAMEMLGLTDEQTKQIEKLRLDTQKKMLPLRNELKEKEARMNTLETAETADMKAINGLIDEIAGIKAKMAKVRAANQQEIRKLLTDEQRIKYDMKAGKAGKGGKMRNQW